MGIKGLNPVAKKRCSDAFYIIALKFFAGKTIVIDWLNWFFTYGPIAVKILIDNMDNIYEEVKDEDIMNNIIKELATFTNKLLKYNINIVWIGDGEAQDNKTVTKIERRKRRAELYKRVKNAETTLLSQNVLERDPNLVDYFKKNKARVTYISTKVREGVENVIKESGMQFIYSQDEAENLGSSLCKEGKIHALWTSDTDAYPLECKLVVKGFVKKNNQDYINAVNTEKIRNALNFNCEEFRDYCILLGTDFNDNIPLVGEKRSYDMITKYRSLEKAEEADTKHKYEIVNLKYRQVRSQLTPYETNFTREELMINRDKKINLDDKILDIPGVIEMIVKIKQFVI